MQNFGDILQLVIVELIYKVCLANPNERSRFIRCIYNLLNSNSASVCFLDFERNNICFQRTAVISEINYVQKWMAIILIGILTLLSCFVLIIKTLKYQDHFKFISCSRKMLDKNKKMIQELNLIEISLFSIYMSSNCDKLEYRQCIH